MKALVRWLGGLLDAVADWVGDKLDVGGCWESPEDD